MTTRSQLIDTAKIQVKAGNGGDGRVSFRREKYISKGGPDGGDGGAGGSITLVADNNMSTLLDFRSKPIFEAQHGGAGGKKKMTGADGLNLLIRVPLGTLVYETRSNDEVLVADMDEPGETFLIAKGGKGGKGNTRFKSSVNQAPTQYTPGEQGEKKDLRLEIKMVADVGLVGFPNSGKSTLLNFLARTKVKVASYPFTTLAPNLGTLKIKGAGEVVFADIPGLIEGASDGKGLGDDFLRHVERTRILVHLIDPLDFTYTSQLTDGVVSPDANEVKTAQHILAKNAMKKYEIIREELGGYSNELLKKSEIIVISKIDITEIKNAFNDIKGFFEKAGVEVLGISGATGEGVEALLERVLAVLEKTPERVHFSTETPVKVFNIRNLPNKRIVFKSDIKMFEGDKKVG